LSHSFVESPDMMNIYNGVVRLDARGRAEVKLPVYFEALNQDFRYQLTAIGASAPLYVAREISGNSFQIAGGKPGLRVSWQVTGIGEDGYGNAHRIVVEEEKPANEKDRNVEPSPSAAGSKTEELSATRTKPSQHKESKPRHGRTRLSIRNAPAVPA